MHNHAPNNYICPICLAIDGIENEQTWIKQSDVFYKDDLVFGFIGSKSVKGNENHPIIVPTKHFENLYDIPDEFISHIGIVSKKVATALKQIRNCDGVTLVQNNEPAGDQHAFHYHLHIVPRFDNDNFKNEWWNAKKSEPEDRAKDAYELKKLWDL